MESRSVLLLGSNPQFVLTAGRLLQDHGYDVVVKAWKDDLSDVFVDPPEIMVMHGPEMATVDWSVLEWLEQNPMTRYIPVLVCAEQVDLLPYAVRALLRRPGLVVASSMDRGKFLAKLSALQGVDMLQGQAR